jgi:hypothetical protein
MLEYESLPGMTDAKPSGLRSSNGLNIEEKKSEKITIETLIRKLSDFLKNLNAHGVDPEIVNQIFKQVCQKKKKKKNFFFFLINVFLFQSYFFTLVPTLSTILYCVKECVIGRKVLKSDSI